MSTSRQSPEFTRLLTPAEVAAMFRVDPKTVTRWAKDGKLTSVRTLGGHRRYPEAEERALLDQISGSSRPRVWSGRFLAGPSSSSACPASACRRHGSRRAVHHRLHILRARTVRVKQQPVAVLVPVADEAQR